MLRNLAIICCTTELVRGMGLFLGWRHSLICIILSLCKHACKEVCDINPGIDPYHLLARSWNRWWPDFVTFTACKKSRLGLKRGKEAQCVSNRCKELFERKKIFWGRCTLTVWTRRYGWKITTSSSVHDDDLHLELKLSFVQSAFFLVNPFFFTRLLASCFVAHFLASFPCSLVCFICLPSYLKIVLYMYQLLLR